jgi:hypothetical protein
MTRALAALHSLQQCRLPCRTPLLVLAARPKAVLEDLLRNSAVVEFPRGPGAEIVHQREVA